MQNTGPALEVLIHRLAETPAELLAAPRIGNTGAVHVAALVNDVLALHGARATLAELAPFMAGKAGQRRQQGHQGHQGQQGQRLALVMIVAWLLADEWLIAAPIPQADLLRVLDRTVDELAQSAAAHRYVDDPERREELARIVLARLGYRPAGESVSEATDRLSAVSGAERRRLLEASRAAEQRAADIRAALARKAAEESADKWSRE
ncbi:hypothetical protein ASF61_16140 [Duganella sp. Leaf126]|uniref:hypothetical protein n=1 Tax=Duganella sp. Leaf126 TaxID=1736266 RepID=UPI00070170FD|nr:hypothetical protein [Duganella sp. Leaf126]KQQ31879.1 hypothetical protein ASF61_16140 [Duganella sp. Leaf126]